MIRFLKFLTCLTITAAALTGCEQVADDNHSHDDIKIEVKKLSDTIYVLFGDGGNIGVSAGADGIVIIDDKYEGYADAIKTAIATISDNPIGKVINTHWHFDHAGSNDQFGNEGATLIAHDNVRERLITGGFLSLVDVDVPPAKDEALPVITFNDTMTLYLNGEAAHIIHVKSAHTDGDAIVWFETSNIIHAGDTFLNGIYPLIDYNSGGTIEGMITATDILIELSDDQTQIIPGHGAVSDISTLKAYRELCITMRDRIGAMKAKGMTLDEIIAAKPMKDYDEKWGSWGDRWTAISLESFFHSLP